MQSGQIFFFHLKEFNPYQPTKYWSRPLWKVHVCDKINVARKRAIMNRSLFRKVKAVSKWLVTRKEVRGQTDYFKLEKYVEIL